MKLNISCRKIQQACICKMALTKLFLFHFGHLTKVNYIYIYIYIYILYKINKHTSHCYEYNLFSEMQHDWKSGKCEPRLGDLLKGELVGLLYILFIHVHVICID